MSCTFRSLQWQEPICLYQACCVIEEVAILRVRGGWILLFSVKGGRVDSSHMLDFNRPHLCWAIPWLFCASKVWIHVCVPPLPLYWYMYSYVLGVKCLRCIKHELQVDLVSLTSSMHHAVSIWEHRFSILVHVLHASRTSLLINGTTLETELDLSLVVVNVK